MMRSGQHQSVRQSCLTHPLGWGDHLRNGHSSKMAPLRSAPALEAATRLSEWGRQDCLPDFMHPLALPVPRELGQRLLEFLLPIFHHAADFLGVLLALLPQVGDHDE